jgi:hypothetical protein
MCSGEGTRALPRVGFPIRKSSDQRLISSSPRLIAAVHVLHRLQVPRHPPCALSFLISIENTTKPLWSFQGARGKTFPPAQKDGRPPRRTATTGLSKLNSSGCRCRRIPGEPRDPDGIAAITTGAPAAVGAAAFPRKEVIQPQLPLRLPCYDFTPITDATFGRCLPKGLAHGLRVFPAFVV